MNKHKCIKQRQYHGVYVDCIYMNRGIWRVTRAEKHGVYYIFYVKRDA